MMGKTLNIRQEKKKSTTHEGKEMGKAAKTGQGRSGEDNKQGRITRKAGIKAREARSRRKVTK